MKQQQIKIFLRIISTGDRFLRESASSVFRALDALGGRLHSTPTA
jgi:hypothetical protein